MPTAGSASGSDAQDIKIEQGTNREGPFTDLTLAQSPQE